MDGGPPRTLPQLWRSRCAERADAPAARHKQGGIWMTMTRRELMEQARAAAMQLRHSGVREGDVVALVSHNRPEWLVLELATQAIGAMVHCLYPHAPGADIDAALRATGARVAFVDTVEQLEKVRASSAADFQLVRVIAFETAGLHGAAGEHIVRWRDWLARGAQQAAERPDAFDGFIDEGDADTPALIASTSGTAGVPRLVSVSQRELLARIRAGARWMPVATGDFLLSFAPLSQIAERVTVLTALLVGGVVHFPEGPATVFNDLAEVAPHLVCAPPRFWKRLHDRVDLAMEDAPSLARRAFAQAASGRSGWWARTLARRVRTSLGLQRMRMGMVLGGEIGGAVADWYQGLGAPLYSAYCLTEAAGVARTEPMGGGPALATGLQVELAEDGEIVIGGLGDGVGYWAPAGIRPLPRDELGRLQTGDIGSLGAAGLRVLGSKDEGPAAALAGQVRQAVRRSALVADLLFLPQDERSGRLVIALEEDRLRRRARAMGLHASDFGGLAAHPRLQAQVRGEIECLLSHLAGSVTGLAFMTKPPRPGDEEWTPMLRLRHAALRLSPSH